MLQHHSPVSRFLGVMCALFCVVASAKAQDKVLLRLNLHQGQTFDQSFVIEQKISQTIQKNRMDMTMTMRFGLHNEVLGVDDDGTIKLKTTYQSVAMSSSGNSGGNASYTLNYDSTKPSQNVPVAMQPLAALVGQSLIVTASPRGDVLKIEGIDAIVQRIIADTKDAAMRDAMSKDLKTSMEGQSKQIFGMAIFSESPVGVGDVWNAQHTQSSVTLLLISAQYTLISLQNGIATLAVRSNISSNAGAPPLGGPNNPVKLNLSGTQSGVMHVDEQSGWAQDFELNQRVAGKISMTIPRGTSKEKKTIATPMSWPIYMKSTIHGWTTGLTK